MRRLVNSSSVATLLALTVTLGTFCAQAHAVDRFKVFGDGDFLLVPVEINSKTYSFVVDTGCSTTTFDESLLHVAPKQIDQFATPSGAIPAGLFDVPTSQDGKYKLNEELQHVAGFDLSAIRRASGLNVNGLIGMDFLRKHVVRINFDEGVLELDPDIRERGAATAIDLTFNERGWPCVRGSLKDCYETEFVLDTGCMSFCSGLLETRICRYAEQQGQLQAIGSQSFTDAGQSGTTGIYRATAFNVGGNKLVNPVFQEAKFNCVGLFYLSRFNVTLDFPNKRALLTPGKRPYKTDGRNLGGMDLVQKDGKIVIDSINTESQAEKAGLHVDDEIVSLGDLVLLR